MGTASSYDVMTRTYAQLFTTYVVYCNRSGFEDGVGFWGGSRRRRPGGTVVAEVRRRARSRCSSTASSAARSAAPRVAYPLLRDERNDVNDAETDRTPTAGSARG